MPLFLQPITYDPTSAPPIPGQPQSPSLDRQSHTDSPSVPQSISPPPPRKIPLDKDVEDRVPKMIPKSPQYDPQHTHNTEAQHVTQKPRRPQFDPQNSHDDVNSAARWQRQEQQPSIPPPQFTSFDVESALPPISGESDVHGPLQLNSSRTKYGHESENEDMLATRNQQQVPGSSSTTSGPWNSQIVNRSSRDQYSANIIHQDGLSTSTTDMSSNTAGKSTPESNNTSNTSYREIEQNVHDEQNNNSFYWHSGRSSSDAEDEHTHRQSPTVLASVGNVDQRSSATMSTVVPADHHDSQLPARTTSLSPAVSVPYGASALGLGGPSDWEYFGDYEADEIDDEELYSKPRGKASVDAAGESAELPANSPYDILKESDTATLPESHMGQRLRLAMSENVSVRDRKLNYLQTGDRGKSSPQQKIAHRIDNHNVRSEQNVDTLHTFSAERTDPSGESPEQRLDLDEVIRAWSEAPDVGKVQGRGTATQDNGQGTEEPQEITEASLASTPRERLLGVDESLKDAPSMPKLSDTAVHSERNNSDMATQLKRASISQDAEQPVNVRSLSSQVQPKGSSERAKLDSQTFSPAKAARAVYQANDSPSTEPKVSVPDSEESKQELETRGKPSAEPAKIDDIKASSVVESTVLTALSSQPLAQEIGTEDKFETTDVNLGHGPDLAGEDMLTDEQQVQSRPPTEAIRDVAESRPSRHSSATSSPILEQASTGMNNPESAEEPIHGADTINHDFSKTERPRSQNISSEISKSEITSRKLKELPAKESSEDFPTRAGAVESHNVPASQETAAEEVPQNRLSSLNSDPRPILEASRRGDKSDDPYADLDSWGKASLNRFAAMLREEARAETNKDKLNIFNVFTSRESRLRVVLYGTDDELIMPPAMPNEKPEINRTRGTFQEAKVQPTSSNGETTKDGAVTQAVQRTNTVTLQRSLKALPALPANRDSVIGLPGNALAPLVIETSNGPLGEGDSPSDDIQYSPGGRPLVPRLPVRDRRDRVSEVQDPPVPSTPSRSDGENHQTHSPSSNAPIALQTEEGGGHNTARPLKNNESRSEVKNYLANRKSVIRPYATLTQGSRQSVASFGKGLDATSTSFIGTTSTAPTSLYNVNAQPKEDDASDIVAKRKAQAEHETPELRRFVKADFDPLLTILPETDAVIHESRGLTNLQNVMDAIPDDFSFIHHSVVAWDTKAKKLREENDRQRHARQMESEQRIDSLFDDHEIGYGDISELESEFKRSEAARRTDEDRSEYQLFVSDVFNLVWTRLHYELDQLIPHYEQYSKLMNATLAGKDMFEESSDRLALAPTMTSFLTLHTKLEIRHQKAFEAVLERDRRLKKTEISPWYTLSNIDKVKQLEKQFEDAEKKAIIEYCQQRDSRANRLMDVLDQNTLRGVGANQDYMEAIMKAIRRIASGRAFASMTGSGDPTVGIEQVEKAKVITALLATSSEQIVQTFHVADMLLNSADYEVSVAKAKIAKFDAGVLAKLKEERAKEDQKLMGDLQHRLALIREDSRRTNDEIIKLMVFLGAQHGRADSRPEERAESPKKEHEARIQKALAEAKRRNALKESVG